MFNAWIAIAAQTTEIIYVECFQALNLRFTSSNEMHVIVNRPAPHSLLPCVKLGRNHILHAHLNKPHTWQNAFSYHFCGDSSVDPYSQSASRQSGESFIECVDRCPVASLC